MQNKKPIIGITLDIEENNDSYSEYPWYALRRNYADAIIKYGGVPIMLPHYVELVDEYIHSIDGLMMTGGFYDVDPKCYGESSISDKLIQKDSRTNFELGIFKAAFDKQMPVLGICAGEQIMNVALGGTLHQHIPDDFENCLEHEQKTPKHETSHEVRVQKSSKLFEMIGSEIFNINSTHHQAVKVPGKGMHVVASAPDGVIEAIEHESHRFCVGVEWHPEYLSTPEDHKLFECFVRECSK